MSQPCHSPLFVLCKSNLCVFLTYCSVRESCKASPLHVFVGCAGLPLEALSKVYWAGASWARTASWPLFQRATGSEPRRYISGTYLHEA
eukprot:5355929-Amphidinium_carterae.1